MKTNLTLSILLLTCLLTTAATAQSSYVMFLSMYLDPAQGKAVELVNGVKDHNKKFHAQGESQAYLWRVVSGPHSGQYAWAQGPMKYAKMDESLSTEHDADWERQVAIYCKNISENRFWKRMDDYSYNPENEVVGENALARIFYGVTDLGSAMQQINKIKDVLVAKKASYARRVYTSEFRNTAGEDIMLVYPFDSWKELETRKGLAPNFQQQFDEVMGAGSWAKSGAALSDSAQGWYDEVRVMVK